MTRLAVTQALQRLAAFAREADLPIAREAVIVGGALRDVLLSRSPREIDIALPGDARAFARAAAEQLGSRAIPIDDRLGVDRLPFADGSIDIVRRSADLATDLARRDFTINALAFPLVDLPASGLPAVPRERLIDQHGGLADLDARLLRTTGPTVLREDPLRALRAARFVAELGFRIDPATAAGVAEVASLVRSVAPERVGAELQRLFAADRAFSGVALMEEVGLLSVCFPELDAGRGLEQRPHHRYDVFRHQLASLQWLDVLLSPQPPADETEAGFWAALWRGADWDDLRDHLGWQAVPLRLAVLLHDVGKPATYRAEPDGRTRFFGHAELGAAMTRDALQRWRIPQAIVQRVALLIEQHLRPGQIAALGSPPTDRALHRFHKALGEAVPALCWLFLADSIATAGPDRLAARWPAYVAHAHRITRWRPPESARRLRRLVDGHAVMAHTSIAAGPLVGRILTALEEAAATGQVQTREEALALAATMAAAAPPREARPAAGADADLPGRNEEGVRG